MKTKLIPSIITTTLASVLMLGSANTFAAGESHLYLLNQSLNDQIGNANLVSHGGTITAEGYQFSGTHDGLSLTNALTGNSYTIDMSVTFSKWSAVSAYTRLIEFKNLTSDNGLYAFRGGITNTAGALDFYRVIGSNPNPIIGVDNNAFQLNQNVQVTLTRTNSGTVTGYINGVEQIHFEDTANQATFSSSNNIANFFIDDYSGYNEEASGAAKYIRIFDTALNATQVSALTAPVPEPETYAMLLAGLGLMGAVARRRKQQ
jgi:hypothetical protein